MREVFLVFRLGYVIDSSTILPIFVKEFDYRDEAATHVKEHGGFIFAVLVPPSRDLRGSQSGAMIAPEMGTDHE